LEFLWELVIREERFWNFYSGVVTRRHSFGKSQKPKFLILAFGIIRVVGMKSLRFFCFF
jgi:hypothetical protein